MKFVSWNPSILCGIVAWLALASSSQAATPDATLRRIADLNPGSVGSFPSNITVHAGSVILSAYTQETGTELWRYDGTNITLVRDINPTADDIGTGTMVGNDSFPAWLTPLAESLYFSAFDPMRGGELWVYDGVDATRAADVNPDLNDTIKFSPNSSWPAQLTVLNDLLYFSANGSTTTTNYELWRFDGQVASLVIDIHPNSGTNHSSHPNGLTVLDGALYFMADDGVNGYELWRHDGGTPLMLTNINPGGSASSSFPKYFTSYNGSIYFQAFHDNLGFELWRVDGTTVSLAADLNTGPASSIPEYPLILNGILYFRAADALLGSELWRFDGTNATVVQNINPAGDAYPKNLTLFEGLLYFAADDGIHGWELWKTDGQTASLVGDLNPAGDSFPESLVVHNGALYFVAATPETGYEIWRYSDGSFSLAADINPGPGDSYPQFLTTYKQELLFRAAEDGWNDWELWALTDTVLEEPQIASISADSGSFVINAIGTTGVPHILETTSNLNDWTPAATNTPTGGEISFTVPEAGPMTFYRIVVR